MKQWFEISSQEALMILLSGIVIYASILIYTKIIGLRSFSKMSASDFAMTVAVGSLFASSISSPSPTVGMALVALFFLFAGQWAFAVTRRKSSSLRHFLENDPVLLMRDGTFLEENMSRSNITRSDLIAKLREANVLRLEDVKAVVFETTGDVSVLHSSGADKDLDEIILDGVKG